MAAIASLLPRATDAPIAPNDATSNPTSGTSTTDSSVATDALANEQTFLQLLVSQLKNQDPTSPMDGTQFVTQLAQFSQLEQDLAMRQDLDKIAGTITTAPTSSGSTGSGNDPTQNSTTRPVQ
jgi:flagellar basal-body rod modification protein FlgD